MTLPRIIGIDIEKCLNCYKCIGQCPVKFCNKAQTDHIDVNPDLCIGCGECLKVCSHGARYFNDDMKELLPAIERKEKIVAIIAPAIAASFPGMEENFNGFLKAWGIQAVFDVSFGAELTVKSYLDFISKKKPEMVIAQPCPPIVTFIEIYRPQLLPHLAPADSPMLHTAKMIRRFYPQYAEHKIMAVSPCIAKKREFHETGIVDFNITFKSLEDYIDSRNIDLLNYPKKEYDNDPAERAVVFSSPGGLMRTALREDPTIVNSIRKIESPESIYRYLAYLPADLEKRVAPLLLDCLNCEMGCNGGTGTSTQHHTQDGLDYHIEERRKHMQKKHGIKERNPSPGKLQRFRKIVDKYWESGLYKRSYKDRSSHFSDNIKIPDESEIQQIYHSLLKYSPNDILNCGSCGYGKCEKMAIAIHNGLNFKENCLFYLKESIDGEREQKHQTIIELQKQVRTVTDNCSGLASALNNLVQKTVKQNEIITRIASEIQSVTQNIGVLNEQAIQKQQAFDSLVEIAKKASETLSGEIRIIQELAGKTGDMNQMLTIMDDVAGKTNLLAMNASIEAAHAGVYGKGFAVVAQEIRKLASSAMDSTGKISGSLKETMTMMSSSLELSQESRKALEAIDEETEEACELFKTIISEISELSSGSARITNSVDELNRGAENLKRDTDIIQKETEDIMTGLSLMMHHGSNEDDLLNPRN